MTAEQIEFVEWVGEQYIRVDGGWMHRYVYQLGPDNLLQTETLWLRFLDYKAALDRLAGRAPHLEKDALGLIKTLTQQYQEILAPKGNK